MTRVVRILGQVLAYAAFAFVVGYFSFWPTYQYGSPEMATVKISLSHATERVVPCVQLSPEEVAKLPPNMRRAQVCERQRLPLILELDVDGKPALAVEASPSGLWEDGPASVYERFDLPAGPHTITVRMRDSAEQDAWDYTHTETIVLDAGRYTTITFQPENGGFVLR